jgi:hypothetical protein
LEINAIHQQTYHRKPVKTVNHRRYFLSGAPSGCQGNCFTHQQLLEPQMIRERFETASVNRPLKETNDVELLISDLTSNLLIPSCSWIIISLNSLPTNSAKTENLNLFLKFSSGKLQIVTQKKLFSLYKKL